MKVSRNANTVEVYKNIHMTLCVSLYVLHLINVVYTNESKL